MSVFCTAGRIVSTWLVVLLLFSKESSLKAQPARLKALEFTSFHERKQAAKVAAGIDDDRSHPDYGYLPYRDAPCSDCQELLHKRTENAREFIRQQSGGVVHLLQYAAGPINYQDENGHWREIDGRLHPMADGRLVADRQLHPVFIDPSDASTSILVNGQQIIFNRSIRLLHQDESGVKTDLGNIDWTGLQAGDDGAIIRNAYPGVDLVFQVRRGTVESGFLLNSRLPFQSGTILLRFETALPSGFSVMKIGSGGLEDASHASFRFLDPHGQPVCQLRPCFAFDDAAPEEQFPLTTRFDRGAFEVAVPVDWLNDPSRKYPVLIDPVVTTQGVLPDGVGGVEGTRYSAVCWTNGCDYQLVVPTPANARLTGVYSSFEYYAATGRCQAQDGGYSISLNGCTAPSAAPGVFTCASPLSNFYCGASNLDITADVSGCLPADRCASQNLNFTLHFYRCNNDTGTTCASSCISASQPWIITLEGRDLELPFVSSPQQVCQGRTVQVVAAADFGIGPYSYAWSPVASADDTLSVTPASTTSYSVTVTDACGTQRTATADVLVSNLIHPGFGLSDTVACAGAAIQLSGYGSGAATSYDWIVPGSDAPGGVIDDNAVPVVRYSLPGLFPVTLRFSESGCSDDSTLNVLVRAPQPAEVSLAATPSGVICPGDLVQFTATDVSSFGALNYSFYLNGAPVQSGSGSSYSSSALQNGDIVQVVMTSAGDCIVPPVDTASLFIAVSGNVTPDVQIVANDVCTGVPVLLTAAAVNGGTSPVFQWFVNGNSVPGAINPTWSTTLSSGDTVVSVQMTSSLGCVTVPVAVDALAVAPISPSQVSILSDVGQVICSGETVTVTAQPVNGGLSPDYSWYLNGIATGDTGQVYVSTGLLSGDQLVVQMTSSSSCATPATASSLPMAFQVAPPLDFLVFGSPPVCEGETVTLAAGVVSGDGGPYTYFWNGVQGSESYSFQPSYTQYVRIEVEDGCENGPARDSALVIVRPLPSAGFAFDPFSPSEMNPVVQFSDTSKGAAGILWFFGDGDSSLSRNPSHLYSAPGAYQVTQIVNTPFGCMDTLTYTIIYREDSRIWFPNSFTPNGDLVNDAWIPVGIGLGSYRYSIWDRWGGKIFEGDQDTPWPGTYKDTDSQVQQGVYTWVVELDKKRFSDNKLAGTLTLIRVIR